MSARQRAWGAGLLLACLALGVWLGRWLEQAEVNLRSFDGAGSYALAQPGWLALLACAPWLAWVALHTLAHAGPMRRWLGLCARLSTVAALALALARPERRYATQDISAVALLDVSESVTDADLQDAQTVLSRVRAAQGEHALSALAFAGRAEPLASDAALTRNAALELQATDVQHAIQAAISMLEPGALPRVLLVSDGKQTRGDALAEAARAASLSIPIHYVPLTRGRPPELSVRRLELPEAPEVGQTFEAIAHVDATTAGRAKLRLYQGDMLNALDPLRELELPAGSHAIAFRTVARVAGPLEYRIELEPMSADRFAENNTARQSTQVAGRPVVLLVDREPAQLQAVARALTIADFEVDLRAPEALPRSLAELARYAFVVLSDVPAEQLAEETQQALERYVRDLGGGFMMAGGGRSFGLGGYAGTRMEALLPVRMDSERRREEHSLALALVIDCSGSMSGAKMELAKEAARATAELLSPSDSLGVVAFSGSPERRVRMQSAGNRVRIAQDIARMTAQGGTAIFPALDMALTDLIGVRARVKHVILLTDGQTQESGLPELAQAMRAESITVSTVGLGNDVNRRLLEQIASVGGGRSYFTADPTNVPRIFMRETSAIAQSSVIEELSQAIAVAPADFLKGIDLRVAPLLRGYVATQPRPRPAQVVLASEQGEPLLARMRVGLGWSLAWTSDLKPRWSREWLRWRALPVLLGQLVREHMRKERDTILPLRVEPQGDEALISVDAVDPNERFINGLDVAVTRTPPKTNAAGAGGTAVFALPQRAPGYYAARVPLAGLGTFTLAAEHRRDGELLARGSAQVTRSYPAEYEGDLPGEALLAQITARSGGQRLVDPAALFEVGDEHVQRREDLWPWFVLAGLLLTLLDLLIRRLPSLLPKDAPPRAVALDRLPRS